MVLAIVIFGLAMLNLSLSILLFRNNRYDGYVQLEEDPGGVKRASLIMEGDPETLLQTKKSIRFKIRRDEVSRS